MSYPVHHMEAGSANPVAADGLQAEQDRRALRLMVEYVCTETRSDGCAIALDKGTAVVAEASTGIAPQVGAVLHPDSGLSGECLRTGVIVHCKDTASDSRTNPEVCRQMGISSVLVVPILAQEKTVGILEVFSGQTDNFLDSDIEVLQRVADVVAALICRNGSP
jgi:diguanylate cyclase